MPRLTNIVLVVLAAASLGVLYRSGGIPHLKAAAASLQSYLPLVKPQYDSDNVLKNPLDSKPSFHRKIVAVGDLHGDLPNALRVLQMAHVVDADGDWSGEIDIFVQTGDIIDR